MNIKTIFTDFASNILFLKEQNEDSLGEEQFNQIIVKAVSLSLDDYEKLSSKTKKNYNNFFPEAIENNFNKLINETKQKDIFQIIENLTKKYGELTSFPNAVEFLNELGKEISNNKINLSALDILDLATNNDSIIASANTIVSAAMNSKLNNKYAFLESKIKNEILLELIDCYMDINNIDFEIEYTTDVDSVRQYFGEMARYPLLTREEEGYLSKLIKEETPLQEKYEIINILKSLNAVEDRKLSVIRAKNEEQIINYAKNDLINHNLKLAVSCAKKYTGKGLELLDLIQAGNTGLITAANRFDGSKGYKFSTYAICWIRQSIAKELGNCSKTIRVPIHVEEQMAKYKSVFAQYIATHSTEPTDEELIELLGWKKETFYFIKSHVYDFVSIYSPIGEDDAELIDFIEDESSEFEDVIMDKLTEEEIVQLLDEIKLSDREVEVIKRRFGIGYDREYTLEEIGKELQITRERVRQLEAKSLRRIRVGWNVNKAKRSELILKKKNEELLNPKPKQVKTPKDYEVKKYLYGINAITDEDKLWNRYFLILKAYVLAHDNAFVPFDYKTKDGRKHTESGYELGKWLIDQKQLLRTSKLSIEKMEALLEIGVNLDRNDICNNLFTKKYVLNEELSKGYNKLLYDWILSGFLNNTNSITAKNTKISDNLSFLGLYEGWLRKFCACANFAKTTGSLDCLLDKQNILVSENLIDWFRREYYKYRTNELSKIKKDLFEYLFGTYPIKREKELLRILTKKD